MTVILLGRVRELVHSGGWEVRGGRWATNLVLPTAVTEALIVDNTSLMLWDKETPVTRIALDGLICELFDEERPRLITIRGPYRHFVRENRKKSDGGGYREVEKVDQVNQLILVHAETQAQLDAEQARLREERAERERVAQQRRTEVEERARKERELQATERIRSFFDRLKVEIVGMRVKEVLLNMPDQQEGFAIVFEGGHVLNVHLDGGDTWDAWINLHSGPESISLRHG